VKWLVRLVVIAVAVYLATLLVPGVVVRGGAVSYLVIALVFALVNLLVKPLVKLLSLPLVLLTLGLFLLVINAAMVGLTALLTGRLDVDGFAAALLTALVISAVTWVADLLGVTERR
jgi:putative membrane protein